MHSYLTINLSIYVKIKKKNSESNLFFLYEMPRYLAEVEAIVSDYAVPGRSHQQSGVTHDDMERYAKQLIGMPMTYCHRHPANGYEEHVKHGRFSAAWIDDDDLLHVKVLLENNEQGKKILKKIQSGFLTGFSLGLNNGSGIKQEGGRNKVVHAKDLVELSITPNPEFKMTSCIQHVNLTPDADGEPQPNESASNSTDEPFIDHSIKLGSLTNQLVEMSVSSGKYDKATEAKIEEFQRELQTASAENFSTSEKTKQQKLLSNKRSINSQPTPLSQKRKSQIMSQQQQSRSRTMTRTAPTNQRGARAVVYDDVDDNADNAVEYDEAGDQYDQDQMAMDQPAQQQRIQHYREPRRKPNQYQEEALRNGSMFRQQPSKNEGPIVVNNHFTLPDTSERGRRVAAREAENNSRLGNGRQPQRRPPTKQMTSYDDDNDNYQEPIQQPRARAPVSNDDDDVDEQPIDREMYELPKIKTMNARNTAEMDRKAREKFERLSLSTNEERRGRQQTAVDTNTFEDFRRYQEQLRGDRRGPARNDDAQKFEKDYREYQAFVAMKEKYEGDRQQSGEKKRRNQSVSGRRAAPMIDDADADDDIDDKIPQTRRQQQKQQQQRQQMDANFDDDDGDDVEEETEFEKLRRENQALKAKLSTGKRSTKEMVDSINSKLKKPAARPQSFDDDDNDTGNYAATDGDDVGDGPDMGIDESIDEMASAQAEQSGKATKILDDGRDMIKMYDKLTKMRAEFDILKSTDTSAMNKGELDAHEKKKGETASKIRSLNADYIEKTRQLSADGLQFISKMGVQNNKGTPDLVRKKFINMTLKKMMTPNDINDALGFVQIASTSSSNSNKTLTMVRQQLARLNADKLNALEKIKEQEELLMQGKEKSAATKLVEGSDLLAKAARTSAKMTASGSADSQQQQQQSNGNKAAPKIFKSADPINARDNYKGYDPITKLPVDTDINELPIAQVYGVPFKVLTEDQTAKKRAEEKGFVGKAGFPAHFRQEKHDTAVAGQYITKPQISCLRGLHRTGDTYMMDKVAKGRITPGTDIKVGQKMFSGRHRMFEKPSDATITVDENNKKYYLLDSATTLAKQKQQQLQE